MTIMQISKLSKPIYRIGQEDKELLGNCIGLYHKNSYHLLVISDLIKKAGKDKLSIYSTNKSDDEYEVQNTKELKIELKKEGKNYDLLLLQLDEKSLKGMDKRTFLRVDNLESYDLEEFEQVTICGYENKEKNTKQKWQTAGHIAKEEDDFIYDMRSNDANYDDEGIGCVVCAVDDVKMSSGFVALGVLCSNDKIMSLGHIKDLIS